VLEGRYGFLHAYCEEADASRLTDALGERFETLALCIKRYACHIVAHTPIYCVQQLQSMHEIEPECIDSIRIEGASRLSANHDLKAPGDAVLAQYSVPYCVSAALLRDADEPSTFGTTLLDDPAIAALAQRVRIVVTDAAGLATRTRITLNDGTFHEASRHDFPGCPGDPLTREQLREKFMRMTRRLGRDAAPLFERLEHIEREADLSWLDAAIQGEPA
jgi:2-methylcitrate dehydratase PrpD